MNILYHSAVPWVHTGYGRCTQEIAPRLHNEDHKVDLQSMNAVTKGSLMWHGESLDYELDEPMKVHSAEGPFGLRGVVDNFDEADADLYFTHFDTWMRQARNSIPEMSIPYVSYVIVDHDPVPKAVIEQVQNAEMTVAMSEWGKMKMEDKGARPICIPHGVDTDDFKPLGDSIDDMHLKVEDAQTGELNKVNVNDRFIVGMVAANHGDRKRIPQHLEAFKKFLDEVDEDALMYVHTEQNAQEGYNLGEVFSEIGVPQRNLIWPSSEEYGEVGDAYLNRWYNAFDVLVNCSQGESWGLTITEAMAAGTPAIVTNFSSMPEQLGVDPHNPGEDISWVYGDGRKGHDIGVAPHGMVVNPAVGIWRERVSSKQYVVSSSDIYQALKYYHSHPDLREEHGEKAREYVVDNYDWEEEIVPQWNELFNALEAQV